MHSPIKSSSGTTCGLSCNLCKHKTTQLIQLRKSNSNTPYLLIHLIESHSIYIIPSPLTFSNNLQATFNGY